MYLGEHSVSVHEDLPRPSVAAECACVCVYDYLITFAHTSSNIANTLEHMLFHPSGSMSAV